MRRILVLALLALTGLQDNELSAKTKGPDKSEVKTAEKVIASYGTGNTQVTIKTSAGTIRVVLYDETPLHRDNFIQHAMDKTYNGVIFHRVIKDFMIQAGDPTSKNTMMTATYGATNAGAPVPAEIRSDLFHHRGALAAARAADDVNPEHESSGSQFYIVTGEVQTDSMLNARAERGGSILPMDRVQVYKTIGGTPHLDGGYTIFGRVTKGMKVVERINEVPTDYKDRPRKDIFIKSMTVRRRGQ
ncbi:peptidylprolyl isomerase [Alistipes sp. OttesenSCG-928-L06]|nr:peptidylprolyl isomerase [Alistipes sp. OttesenSCG-928-L06]